MDGKIKKEMKELVSMAGESDQLKYLVNKARRLLPGNQHLITFKEELSLITC
ncbi:MAG: hypothetical protein ACFFCS_21830 [Candidatus Hodarchaeota archaeon]